MNKKILVTGGFGFLGGHLAERKFMEGHTVYVWDNMTTANTETYLALKNIVRFVETLPENIKMMDEIYHFASPASPTLFDSKAKDIIEANVEMTWKLLENCKNDVKFFYASSSEVYGNSYFAPEESYGHVDPVGPRAVYDEAKRLGEAICSLFHRKRKLNITIGRIFNTYGPRMPQDGRVIQTFIQNILADRPLPIYGSGMQTRSFCYVDDLIEAILTVVEKNKGFDIVNLGNDEEITILHLADRIAILADRKARIEFLPRREEPPARKPNLTKLRKKYGFEPKITLNEGLRRTVEWYKK